MRKFLISSFPNSQNKERRTLVSLKFLSVNDSQVIFLEKKGGKSALKIQERRGGQIKGETPLSPRQLQGLSRSNKAPWLERYELTREWNDNTLYIHQYTGNQKGLIIATIYFNKKNEASGFVPPLYCRDEVTYDPRYEDHLLPDQPVEGILPLTAGSYSIGAIPLISKKGNPRVVLITNHRGTQWIFPKGQPEKDLSLEEVALMEAEEEAGVKGYILGPPVRLPYKKPQGVIDVLYFPLAVTKVRKSWPEEEERRRQIVPLEEGEAWSSEPSVAGALQLLRDRWVD